MESKHSTKPGQNRWGSLYVIASVMGSAVASGWISPEVAGGQWKAMVVYITGLMTQTNITATNLAQEIGEVSHDAISRMLAGASWSLTVGICLAIRVIEQIGGEGWLIVDDVLIPKVFGREIAFCGWDHDHPQPNGVWSAVGVCGVVEWVVDNSSRLCILATRSQPETETEKERGETWMAKGEETWSPSDTDQLQTTSTPVAPTQRNPLPNQKRTGADSGVEGAAVSTSGGLDFV